MYIAQNDYCSQDIYLQSSENHKSVILQVKRELNRFHWLKSVQSFPCSDIIALQRKKGHASFCLLFCFQIFHLQQRVLISVTTQT